MLDNPLKNIAIYGGNGFVGSHIAQSLVERGQHVTCVSRRGAVPTHLEQHPWAQKVTWLAGDAGAADPDLLSRQDAIITTVGAPPLPTFSKAAFDQSVYTNGQANRLLFEAAHIAGTQRAILIGAKIPPFLQQPWFAYATGKKLAFDAALEFSTQSADNSAVVIQPGGIFGTRYTSNGTAIPLGTVMGPMAKLVPSQLVSVSRLADCAADAAMCLRAMETNFTVIAHTEI